MDKNEIIEQALRIIHKELPEKHWQIFLFGSQAKGTAHESSDIDIGILGPAPVPLDRMAAIHEMIEELPTLRSVDVVDLRTTSQRFRKQALAKTKALN